MSQTARQTPPDGPTRDETGEQVSDDLAARHSAYEANLAAMFAGKDDADLERQLNDAIDWRDWEGADCLSDELNRRARQRQEGVRDQLAAARRLQADLHRLGYRPKGFDLLLPGEKPRPARCRWHDVAREAARLAGEGGR